MANRETKQLMWLSAVLILLALCMDFYGFYNACISAQCEGGSWFLGSTLCLSIFLIPGLFIHYKLPNKLKTRWIVVPIGIALWLSWIILRAVLTNGEEFRPTLILILSIIIFYKLGTSMKQGDKV